MNEKQRRIFMTVAGVLISGFSVGFLIHVSRIPPPLNYLARINESEGGGMNRFMNV